MPNNMNNRSLTKNKQMFQFNSHPIKSSRKITIWEGVDFNFKLANILSKHEKKGERSTFKTLKKVSKLLWILMFQNICLLCRSITFHCSRRCKVTDNLGTFNIIERIRFLNKCHSIPNSIPERESKWLKIARSLPNACQWGMERGFDNPLTLNSALHNRIEGINCYLCCYSVTSLCNVRVNTFIVLTCSLIP